MVDKAKDIAKKYLSQIVWHDIARVMPMYRDVLEVDFQDETPIFRAIKIRHDLVHRNGKTKDGEVIPIGKGTVLTLAHAAEEFVKRIDVDLQLRGAPF